MLNRAALLIPRHTSPVIARRTWRSARHAGAVGAQSMTKCQRISIASPRPDYLDRNVAPMAGDGFPAFYILYRKRSRVPPSKWRDLSLCQIFSNIRQVLPLTFKKFLPHSSLLLEIYETIIAANTCPCSD